MNVSTASPSAAAAPSVRRRMACFVYEGMILFGIGLILFDASQPSNPDFQIRVRAHRHEPDAFYVNQNVRLIADQLGL
jgi:hypothetical protein